MTTSALTPENQYLQQLLGVTVQDEMGTCYRLDDCFVVNTLTGYKEYHFGLQLLGQGETQPLMYVNLDRYDQLISYTPFD